MPNKTTLKRADVVRKRNASLPAYHRLYVLIAEAIRDGRYPTGDLLPSENDLADEHGVSRVTVRKALEHLVDDGLVHKRQGQGNIVSLKAGTEKPVSGLIANLVAHGLKLKVKTLRWAQTSVGNEVAAKLGGVAGESCWLIRRVRYLGHDPVAYASIYLPLPVGKTLKRSASASRLILSMLDETPYRPARTEHAFSATLADGEVADSLGLAVGSPMLRMRGVAYAENGEAVYYQDSLYHPERYEYKVELGRAEHAGEMVWRPLG